MSSIFFRYRELSASVLGRKLRRLRGRRIIQLLIARQIAPLIPIRFGPFQRQRHHRLPLHRQRQRCRPWQPQHAGRIPGRRYQNTARSIRWRQHHDPAGPIPRYRWRGNASDWDWDTPRPAQHPDCRCRRSLSMAPDSDAARHNRSSSKPTWRRFRLSTERDGKRRRRMARPYPAHHCRRQVGRRPKCGRPCRSPVACAPVGRLRPACPDRSDR